MKETINKIVPSVNFHLWQPCNMRCGFCFARFKDVRDTILPKGHLPKEQAIEIVKQLATFGFQKITFVGGEATLCPWLVDLIAFAKDLGMTTMLVTNGSYLKRLLPALEGKLDWVTVSIDSLNPETNSLSGRAISLSQFLKNEAIVLNFRESSEGEIKLEKSTSDFDEFKKSSGIGFDEMWYDLLLNDITQSGFKLKINTVVHAYNCDEDFTEFMKFWKPERWKIFQVLPVIGQNEKRIAEFSITEEAFSQFMKKHDSLKEIIDLVPEQNELMRGSYVMIDPAGRFFDNASGMHHYSKPILEVGVKEAYNEVTISNEKFRQRGGLYNW